MKYMQNCQSVAHAVAEAEGRHAGLLAEDAAQVRRVVVMKALGYLLYGQVGGVEQVLDHQADLYVDLFLGRGAEIFPVDDVQVIGGDVEPVGIISHVVMPGVMPGALIGMLFNSVLNICDGMFVGHGVGSNALAAINIVAPLFLVCTGIGLMFGIGASVIGGIQLAEGNVKAARIIMTQAYIAGGVIFGIVIPVSLLFARPLLYALGCIEALE